MTEASQRLLGSASSCLPVLQPVLQPVLCLSAVTSCVRPSESGWFETAVPPSPGVRSFQSSGVKLQLWFLLSWDLLTFMAAPPLRAPL